MTETPVLIVGGGPVGLSAAILLGRLGVRSLLIERHPSTTDHPKSRAVLTRTMEVLRPWGVERRYALTRSLPAHFASFGSNL